MFAADGAVPESSQSGTPQGEGKYKLNAPYRQLTIADKLLLFIPIFFSFFNTQASTPEEMREEKKEQEGEKNTSSEESKAAKVKASKPLMPTSTILRLLAELVRSYVGIATLIASYSYTAGQSELIKEVSRYILFLPFELYSL